MEIVNSGHDLEDKLSTYSKDIDEELLRMMLARIQLAREYGEVGSAQLYQLVWHFNPFLCCTEALLAMFQPCNLLRWFEYNPTSSAELLRCHASDAVNGHVGLVVCPNIVPSGTRLMHSGCTGGG